MELMLLSCYITRILGLQAETGGKKAISWNIARVVEQGTPEDSADEMKLRILGAGKWAWITQREACNREGP